MDPQRIVSGSRWVALTTLATSAIGLVTTVLLPKFIRPEEYGLFALGILVMAVIQRLGNFGQNEFIIYKGREQSGALECAFTTFLLSNILFLVLQIVFADALASFFHNPRLGSLYRWMALGYLLSAFILVPSALLNRELEFKKKFWPEFLGVLAYTGVGLSLAISGAGVWALIAATWAMSVVHLVLMWVLSGWRPALGLNSKSLGEMFRYGMPLFLFGLVGYLFQNLDRLALGKFLEIKEVGYYTVAFQFALVLSTKANGIISTVAFPSYAQVQRDKDQVKGLYLKALYASSFAAGAIALATILLADPFIRWVYGSSWLPAVEPLQILALYGFIVLLISPAVMVFMALGQTRTVFYVGLLNLVLAVVFMPLALRFGIKGVALLMTATSLVGGLTAMGLAHRTLGLKIRRVLLPLGIFPVIAFLGLLVGLFVSHWVTPLSWALRSILPAGLGVVLYVGIVLGIDRDIRRILKQLLGGSWAVGEASLQEPLKAEGPREPPR